MARVTVGESIPLALKLYDNSPDKKVKAKVYSPYGDLMGSTYLYHVEDGLYMSSDIKMPDHESVLVVYSIDGSEDYSDSAEHFFSRPKVQNDDAFITGVVKNITIEAEYKTGIVYEIKNSQPVR